MSELTSYSSERIYWAVEQVEREARDIDNLHLDDNLFYIKSDVDAAIAELKKKLEDAKATAYAESVDAGMRERRLRRALWVTRANFAKAETDRWESHVDCGNKRNRKDPAFVKTGKLLFVSDWRILWAKIERKCRAMAEKYGEK